ncbi:hypothetical protein AB0F91_40245 [Amycolatopsis sp. NPDC023774]|uniref:hypothetical protein n=1 Tax=Amycolatopsis sp. NPDC023774 TaxID=3155015 RepID=UPI0033DA6532
MDDEPRTREPRHPAGEEDSSGNHPGEPAPPRRNPRDTPLEDDEGRARPGHPGGSENFRGGD